MTKSETANGEGRNVARRSLSMSRVGSESVHRNSNLRPRQRIGRSGWSEPEAWADFFTLLRGKAEAGAFVDGFLICRLEP